jgi:hypothetical protein
MTVLAGIFLILHGLVHIAVWLAPPPPDAPFSARHSWLLDDPWPVIRFLAILSCALLVAAGVLVVLGLGLGVAMAVTGAAVSLTLVALTFNRWLLGAIAIDVVIIAVALG